jgi:WD40 repeat protein
MTPNSPITRPGCRHASPGAPGHRSAAVDTAGPRPSINAPTGTPIRGLPRLAAAILLLLARSSAGDEPIPMPPDGPRDYRAKFAVVVGINDYQSRGQGLRDLRYAANDAREFRKLLVEEFGYDDARILYLTDAKDEPKEIVDGPPTVAAIRDAFEKWVPSRGLTPDDSVLFFFAGHGLSDGYLAAADSRAAAKEGTCIPVSSLRDWLGSKNKKAVPCRHRLVLLDCCYSGTLFSEPLVARPGPRATLPEQGRQGRADTGGQSASRGDRSKAGRGSGEVAYYLSHDAFVGMTAGLGDQPVADGEGKDRHSFFTRELLRAIRERADSAREGHVFTFTELAAQVRPRVAAELLKREAFADQIPMAGRVEPGEGDFLFRQSIDVEVPWERAESRRIASLSDAGRNFNLDQSLILAVEALKVANTVEARTSLCNSLLYRSEISNFLDCTEGGVTSVTFDQDGKKLAAGYFDRTAGGVILWDVQRWERLESHPLVVAEGPVSSVAFSPDGQTLVAGYGDLKGTSGGVIVWDVARNRRLAHQPLLVLEGGVKSVAFSPDGSTWAAGYEDRMRQGGLILWDVKRLDRLGSMPLSVTEGKVSGIGFSPDGAILGAGYGGKGQHGIVLWNVRQLVRLTEQPLDVAEGWVLSVSFSPDRKTIAAGYVNPGNSSGGVITWDATTLRRLEDRPLVVTKGGVEGVAFSPDSRNLAVGYGDFDAGGNGGLVLWDLVKRERLFEGTLPAKGWLRSVAFSPDSRQVATGYTGPGYGGVVMWDVTRHMRLFQDRRTSKGSVRCVALCPSSTMAAVACNRLDGPSGVIFCDLGRQTELADASLVISEGDVSGLAFSPDGKILATSYLGLGSGGVVLWDAVRRSRLSSEPLLVPEGQVSSVAIDHDEKTLAAGFHSGNGKGGVVLWDLTRRIRLADQPFLSSSGGVWSVSFNPRGKWLAAAIRTTELTGGIALWDLTAPGRLTERKMPSGGQGRCVTYSPDGKLLAVGFGPDPRGGGVYFWDVTREEWVSDHPLFTPGDVQSMAFSPDGRILAAGYHLIDPGGGVILWDMSRRELLVDSPFTLPKRSVFSVTFLPNGRKLAAGYLGTVPLGGAAEAVSGVGLWDIALDSWQHLAAEIAHRNLRSVEWEQFFPASRPKTSVIYGFLR